MRRAIAHLYLFPALAVLALLVGGVAVTAAAQSSSSQARASVEGQQSLEFPIVAVNPHDAPSGYVVGSGEVEMELRGTSASVQVDLEDARPNTTYTVVLSVDDKSTTLGTISTNADGEGQLETTTTLPTGSHQIGIQLLDATTFASPTLVGTSSPATLTVTVATGTTSEGDRDDDEQGQNSQAGAEQENEPGSD